MSTTALKVRELPANLKANVNAMISPSFGIVSSVAIEGEPVLAHRADRNCVKSICNDQFCYVFTTDPARCLLLADRWLFITWRLPATAAIRL